MSYAGLQRAYSVLGLPYRWGARGPSSFDCEGLIRWCEGYGGPDITADQLMHRCTPLTSDQVVSGDLVFCLRVGGFAYHVVYFLAWEKDVTAALIVLGASGGDHTTTTQEAAEVKGARVRYDRYVLGPHLAFGRLL